MTKENTAADKLAAVQEAANQCRQNRPNNYTHGYVCGYLHGVSAMEQALAHHAAEQGERKSSADFPVGEKFTAVENGKYKHIKACAEKWMQAQEDKDTPPEGAGDVREAFENWWSYNKTRVENQPTEYECHLAETAWIAFQKAWNIRATQRNAVPREVVDKIKDMAVAHNMSHTNMCDGAYWRDEFERLNKEALALLNGGGE